MGNVCASESHRPGVIPNCAIYSVTLLSDPYFPFWGLAWGRKWGNKLCLACSRLSKNTGFLTRNHQGPLDLPLTRTRSLVQPQADSQPHAVTAGSTYAPRKWMSCSGWGVALHLFCVYGPHAVRSTVLLAPPTTGPQGFTQIPGARCVSEFRIFHISER